MKKVGLVLVLVLVSCTLLFANAEAETQTQKLKKVDFLLNWKITGDHAPYYVA